jgi:DNA-binding NarL/FixJ family response regulator
MTAVDALLTERQQDVLRRYGAGECIKEIASNTNANPKTVEFHIAKIRRRLRIPPYSPQLLVHAALALGLVTVKPIFSRHQPDYTHD